MKYPFFASFLVLCAVFYHNRKKADRSHAKIMQDYFNRENEANNTRKQPLDDLEYVKIPLDTLPTDVCLDDDIIKECVEDLRKLADESIVNFTGMTNTDLKLRYGPANLPFLQQCDLNYTQLVRILNTWGTKLMELDKPDAALNVFEYAINTRADVSNIYYMTADIYKERNETDKIRHLIESVETLNSVLKDHIIKKLNEYL
ncbi:MAG: hypothetical protein J5525_03420 [Lachnospiraceae bacterium]|nr:hypothetical protein [Lachnospiraceae bacterium]